MLRNRHHRQVHHLGFFLALWVLIAPPGFAASICQTATGGAPAAAPRGLEANGDDLEVLLAADPAVGQLVVSLWLDESTLLGSTTVPISSDGFASAVLTGALAGAETQEIRYHVEATDVLGTALMAPYPFTLLFDCFGGPCTYHLLPGLAAEPLVLPPALSQALESLPHCDLVNNLQGLTSSPSEEIRTGAWTLLHQLELRGLNQLSIKGCHYEWQLVVPFGLDQWRRLEFAVPSADHSHTIAQFAGFYSGAASCLLYQGTGLDDQPAIGSYPTSGPLLIDETRLELSTLCLQGSSSCDPPCKGQAAVDLSFKRCVGTEVKACNPASTAYASALHSASFTIQKREVFAQNEIKASARACGGSCEGLELLRLARDSKDLREEPAETPAEILLTGAAQIAYLADSHEGHGNAYAAGETNFEYKLRVTGYEAACTESDEVQALVESPIEVRSGGIKMKRWWPDGDGFTGGGSGPFSVWNLPVPEICGPPGIDR